MTHPALRGTSTPLRGDLTGRRIAELATVKDDHAAALATTRAALVSDSVEIISIPGGRSYLAPTELVRHLIQVGVQSD
jgi:hypothetical protein